MLNIALIAATALGTPTVTFSPGGTNPGSWSYDGAGKFSFEQTIIVDKGLGSSLDALVTNGARVIIPDMTVGGIPVAPFTLTPVTSTISIVSADGLTTYMTGTISISDLVPDGGTGGNAFTQLSADITVLNVNNTIGSAALNAIAASPFLDLHLAFSGNQQFDLMLDSGKSGEGDFAGTMNVIVPEPCTIFLLGLGAAMVRLHLPPLTTKKRK